MNAALQVLIALAGIAGLFLLFLASAYGVGWLVGVFLLRMPLVGRRHRTGPCVDVSRSKQLPPSCRATYEITRPLRRARSSLWLTPTRRYRPQSTSQCRYHSKWTLSRG